MKKRGANLLALCPFHNEKTPSFSVSPSKGIYKCFGCGAAGNSVKFVMEHDQLTYPEALKVLAKKYNIEVEETKQTEESKEEESLKESLFVINSFAQRTYSENLMESEEGQNIGLSYFRERGFSDEVIEKFELGYSLEAAEAFTQTALKNAFKLELLKKAGLTSAKESSKLDFFRARVMFPIHSLAGKVLGFGGRTLKKDKKIPKYINTPESEIYNKSKILYGAFFAKAGIRKLDECYLVEGYTDVISLFQAGIENVVASSGTSLTTEQVRLIKRFSPNITVLYDGDPAGIKAALRGVEIILESGMNVKVVLLPGGEDPDSYVRMLGANEFKAFIDDNKQDFILFKINLFLEESKNDPPKRAALIKDIVETISKVPDPIQRSIYVKECSVLLEMSEQILISEINKIRRRNMQKAARIAQGQPMVDEPVLEEDKPDGAVHREQNRIEENSGAGHLEKDILRCIIEYGTKQIEEEVTVTEHILTELNTVGFEQEEFQFVFEIVQKELEEGRIPNTDFFTHHEDERIHKLAIELVSNRYELSEKWTEKFKISIPERGKNFVQDVESALARFKLKRVSNMILENEAKLKSDLSEEELLKTLQIHQRLKLMEAELCDVLGTVVLK